MQEAHTDNMWKSKLHQTAKCNGVYFSFFQQVPLGARYLLRDTVFYIFNMPSV